MTTAASEEAGEAATAEVPASEEATGTKVAAAAVAMGMATPRGRTIAETTAGILLAEAEAEEAMVRTTMAVLAVAAKAAEAATGGQTLRRAPAAEEAATAEATAAEVLEATLPQTPTQREAPLVSPHPPHHPSQPLTPTLEAHQGSTRASSQSRRLVDLEAASLRAQSRTRCSSPTSASGWTRRC